MATTALLLIDIQRGLCRGDWAAFEIDRVIGNVNTLAARARSAGLPVVWVQHEEREGLVHGSDAWQLDPRLDTGADELRVRKTACDSFHKTGLAETLQGLGVGRVVVAGLQSDFCIDSSVRGALARGFDVTLAADAHSTCDNGVLAAPQIIAHHNRILSFMQSFGPAIEVVPTAEIRL